MKKLATPAMDAASVPGLKKQVARFVDAPGDGGGFYTWPRPPFHFFGEPTPWKSAQACEVEDIDGTKRRYFLVGIDPQGQLILLQKALTEAPLALGLAEFRTLTLATPLQPRTALDGSVSNDVIGDRFYARYRIQWKNGAVFAGWTLGYRETAFGLFLFKPMNKLGLVEQIFVPKNACALSTFSAAWPDPGAAQAESTIAPDAEDGADDDGDRSLVTNAEQLMQALEQQASMPVVRLGEALTQMGYVTDAQLRQALILQKSDDATPLGQVLVNLGFLSRKKLNSALARKMGYPMVDVTLFPLQGQALSRISQSIAQRLTVLPLVFQPKLLVVAAADPTLHGMLEELEFLSQTRVVAVLGDPEQISKTIEQAYQRSGLGQPVERAETFDFSTQETGSQLLESMELQESLRTAPQEKEVALELSDNTLVRLVNTMISEAHARAVSDIHVEGQAGRARVRIRFRRDGLLSPYLELPHTYRAALVARLKIMADLDISEHRRPQDGKIDFHKFSSRHRLELRVATIPTVNGMEDVVMRLLSSARPIALENLGLTQTNLRLLREAVSRPYGMVLCVGPTGSGKTTTLHSVLSFLNTPERKIWTAEDPIEITQPDLRQVQINPSIDWTFAKALRSFLRADPDIIMVGEIRDRETAHIAIEASLTGHLLLSTLHTNSAAETVTRLIDMGMNPFNFADSLLAVLAQRLVRRLCTHCRVAEPASEELVQELLGDYLLAFPAELRPDRSEVLAQWQSDYAIDGHLSHYHAPGCDHCQGTGYLGRMGLHELLHVTPGIHSLIQTSARSELVQQEAFKSGDFRTLRQDGIVKVLQGLTLLEEVRANCNV